MARFWDTVAIVTACTEVVAALVVAVLTVWPPRCLRPAEQQPPTDATP